MPAFWWSALASTLRRFQRDCVLQPHDACSNPQALWGVVFEVSAPPIDRSVVLGRQAAKIARSTHHLVSQLYEVWNVARDIGVIGILRKKTGARFFLESATAAYKHSESLLATAQKQKAGRSQPHKRQTGGLRDNFQVANSEIVGCIVQPTGSGVV